MTAIARALLAVPPFPGAAPHEVVRAVEPGGPDAAGDIAPGELIAALRHHRVGGAFWARNALAPWTNGNPPASFAAGDPEALLAAIAGHAIHVDGDGPFSALSDLAPGDPVTEACIETLASRYLLDGIRYHDPFTGAAIPPLRLIETLAGWRDMIEGNRPVAAAFGFAHWKRETVEPLLWAGAPVPFRASRASELNFLPEDATIAVWKARVPPDLLARMESGPWRIAEVEDGFIRSAGLGADCVPPLSIVVDDLGVHYDAQRPSRLEEMLARGDFTPADLARARDLREWMVREGVSKYGAGGSAPLPRQGGDRRHILVTGQVEDDRSVQYGGDDVRSNLELLRRVRARNPDAWLIYRPHPDVEAGHRKGAIPTQTALDLADMIDSASPISALIAMVDEVHVITSLAGFEALLHGKSVTTHGTPFFAGWGLTEDLGAPSLRRGEKRSLDQLVVAVLLRYPRYLDPVTNLPCTAEILVMRLLSGIQRQNDALVPLRRLVGRAKRTVAQFVGMR